MVVGSVVARQASGRFTVGLAVLDDDRVLDYTVVPAPAGESDSVALSELDDHAHELWRAHKIEMIISWPIDPPPRKGGVQVKPTMVCGRAEGAVLSAAGRLGVEQVEYVAGAGVRAAAGGGTTQDAVEVLCGAVTNAPTEQHARLAVAAARTWMIRGPS
jgi:hypothetical protein